MVLELTDKIIQLHSEVEKLNSKYMNLWKEEMFLTWRWWVTVSVLVLPWVIWLLVRKKESTNRLLLSGLFVFLMTTLLDSIGVSFGLWTYLYTPFPFLDSYFIPWDLSAFPVFVMLLIQFKPKINPFIKGVFFALVTVFVFEPLFTWMHVYLPLKWEHYYGLPVYVVIYLLAHRVSKRSHFEPIE